MDTVGSSLIQCLFGSGSNISLLTYHIRVSLPRGDDASFSISIPKKEKRVFDHLGNQDEKHTQASQF